jgi:hypothetical protein
MENHDCKRFQRIVGKESADDNHFQSIPIPSNDNHNCGNNIEWIYQL